MKKFTSSNCLIGQTLAIDDSCKIGKGSGLCKKTAFNEFNLVEMSCFAHTQSYDTDRVQRMGHEWCNARCQWGHLHSRLLSWTTLSTTAEVLSEW